MIDFSQARRIMVDSQLRTFDVNDIPLLDAMDSVPRELFVLPGHEDLAYSDQHILVSDSRARRYMLSPMILARLIQGLEIRPGDEVLDVASGRGYAAAVLNKLEAQVVSLDEDEALAASARQSLSAAGAGNVEVASGALDRGHAGRAPYDAILINGAVELRPDALLEQLADGGRLACIYGPGRSAKAKLYIRSGDALGERVLFDAHAPLLAPFVPKPEFTF